MRALDREKPDQPLICQASPWHGGYALRLHCHVDRLAPDDPGGAHQGTRAPMIKPGFIKAQVAKPAANGETSNFLRRLVFSVVDRVAKAHYGPLYSTKYFQVSAAIQAVLDRLGIESRLWIGAVCIAEVFDEPGL